MIIIEESNTFTIHSNEIKTHEKLPKGFYTVCFSKMTGFYLKKENNFVINEKLYGSATQKAENIVKSFTVFNRNCGVILSGKKGIGKTLCAKQICINAYNLGYPILIIDEAYGGLTTFINSIQQEVVILFDEFDKTFGYRDEDKNIDIQNELLPLIDGAFTSKKLYIVTCNNIYRLNDFLLNRPGRFHYHIRFKQLDNNDIEEYLKDRLNPLYYSEIPTVLTFASIVPITYDCLRAICFELNCGKKFREFIGDLNILNTEDYEYKVSLVYNDKTTEYFNNKCMSVGEDCVISDSLYTKDLKLYVGNLSYNTKDITSKNSILFIDKSKLSFTFNENINEKLPKKAKESIISRKNDMKNVSGIIFELKEHDNYNFVF